MRNDRPLFCVPTWRLGGPAGKIVCRKAFVAAVGGTAHAHRDALALTIAGKDPKDRKACRNAAKAMRQLVPSTNPRGEWAKSWWRQHLMYQDWLPNEDPPKIQYRGPTWRIVYDQFYVPVANRAGLTLKAKQWKRP